MTKIKTIYVKHVYFPKHLLCRVTLLLHKILRSTEKQIALDVQRNQFVNVWIFLSSFPLIWSIRLARIVKILIFTRTVFLSEK